MSQYADSKWKRDVDEYKELFKIEERLNNYKRIIGTNKDMAGNNISRNTWLLSIKGYLTETEVYYKWIRGYLKKQEKNPKFKGELTGKRLLIELLIERSQILINEGFTKIQSGTWLSNNFSKAFSLVGMAEGEIKELIIAFGMGVQMTQYLTRSEKDQSNIQGAIDNYG